MRGTTVLCCLLLCPSITADPVAAGAGLHAMDEQRARNASYALFAVAAVEVVAGAALIAASPGRARKLDAELAANRRLMIDHELLHMNRVNKQFIAASSSPDLASACPVGDFKTRCAPNDGICCSLPGMRRHRQRLQVGLP